MKVIRIMLLCAFMVGTAGVTCSDLGVMSVQVKEAQLRETPSFLGAVVAPVGYGDRVNVLEQKGDWTNVKDCRNNQGWIHQSALTKKQVVLGIGGQAPQTASSQEIALAGKGFNADVESRYRSAHRRADYASVDRMESMRVTREEMVQFLTAGNVKPTEGGAR
jgi:SH3-like domain-containing protein